MKNTKKILSVFLALIMVVSIIPMSSITASAATTPSSVSSSEAYNKIYELFEILGDKSFFTTTHTNSCGEKSSGHSCSYCKLSTIITQTWFKNKFGTLSTSQFPKTYYPSGKAIGPDGWSCFGFASFAEWYVFKTNTTDKVTTKYVGTFDSNYSNASSNAKVGDLIRFGANSGHSGIVISCDSTGIKVLDCNWGNVTYNCQIQIHTVRYSNYSTFTISRATNSFASSTPTPETCSCSTSYAGNYVCTTTNTNLYIRSGHGTSYSAIGSIPSGTTVYVSKANGSWAHVTYNGVSGYASMSYLTKQTTQKPTLSLSTSVVNLTLGGTESATVVIDIINDNGNCDIEVDGNNSNCYNRLWQVWQDGEEYFECDIDAKATGTTIFTVKLIDLSNNTVIESKNITAYVSAKTYTISYNANGGTGAPSSQTKTHGTALTLSNTIPTRTGYTFLGWSTSSTATSATYSAGGSFTTNASTTLYAIWKSDSTVLTANSSYSAVVSSSGEVRNYTFTPNTSGKYVIYSTSTQDTKVSLYDSAGRQLASNDDGGENKNFRLEYNMTAGTTYRFEIEYFQYATTGAIPFTFGQVFTISYYYDGSHSVPADQYKDYGKHLTISDTVPFKIGGYTFLGWSTSKTATNVTYQPNDNFTIDADTTLYAVWKENVRVNVILDSNDGSGPCSYTSNMDSVTTTLDYVPKRTGYTLLGWATSSTATSPTYYIGQTYTFTSDTTLYAVWEKDAVTPDTPNTNYTFSIQEPSITEIRNKDGIILHTYVQGNAPAGSYVVWTSSNGNFDEDADGNNLTVIAKNKGYTTFIATLYDADENVLATDSVELYSKSGFFDKIGGFFRSLFGSTKIYEN